MNKAIGNTLPDFKINYNSLAIKTEWYWHKDRHTGQWNRIESPQINPKYIELIFDKGAEHTLEKRESFKKRCQQTEYPHVKARN